jgi:hypothetical protein
MLILTLLGTWMVGVPHQGSSSSQVVLQLAGVASFNALLPYPQLKPSSIVKAVVQYQ